MKPYVIPGLSEGHYIRGSDHETDFVPKLTRARVNEDDSFDFRWVIDGSFGKEYRLSAKGYDPEHLVVRCDCSNFHKEQASYHHASGCKYTFVCKHLAAALDQAIDPSARVIPLSELVEAKQEKIIVPGLTEKHYIRGTLDCAQDTPRLLRKEITEDGKFRLLWEVEDTSDDKFYKLSALGNILKRQEQVRVGQRRWFGFIARCDCPRFQQEEWRTLGTGCADNYVCEHLAEALNDVIDPDADVSDYLS